jgi:beta-lactamase class A
MLAVRAVVVLALLAAVGCGGPATVTPDRPAEAIRAAVERIAAEHPEAVVAVALRHPDVRLSVRGDRPFHAASTMKVPVMIEAFRQVEAGRLAWSQEVPVENRFRSIVDGSAFQITDDTDDALYGLDAVTVRDLTERAITTSSNLATNLLIELVTADSVRATTDRLGAPGMRVLRGVEDLLAYEAGLSNRTTADALATLLEAIRDGRAVSPDASAEMLEILSRQEFTETIPAGLPQGTRVANKTGWITRIHHDGAIVYPDGGAPYVLVVLIEGLDSHDEAARLGAAVSRAVWEALVE